jgi:hypothetical protein
MQPLDMERQSTKLKRSNWRMSSVSPRTRSSLNCARVADEWEARSGDAGRDEPSAPRETRLAAGLGTGNDQASGVHRKN